MVGRNGKMLAHATRVKWFTSVKTLFGSADRNDLLAANLFAKIILEMPNSPKKSVRQEWDEDELNLWFSSPIYTERKRPTTGEHVLCSKGHRVCPLHVVCNDQVYARGNDAICPRGRWSRRRQRTPRLSSAGLVTIASIHPPTGLVLISTIDEFGQIFDATETVRRDDPTNHRCPISRRKRGLMWG